MSASSLAKAVIINLDQNSQRVECLFNPAEYTFSKQNEWTRGAGSGHDLPQIEFSNGQPATLQMQLFFDTYAQRKDVRNHTDKIWELMLVDETLRDPKSGKARPPLVRFQWGKNWTFDAVITRISQRFSLFLDDGTPVRASLDLAFEQIKDTRQLKPQNPTSRGVGGERLWTVAAGDTLPGIAYAVYGTPARWRVIAEHNRLYEVRRLVIGTVLEIPNA